MQKIILVVLAICGLSTAQIKSDGRCPEVQVQKDLQINQYLGVWYENQKYPSINQIGSKCNKVEYSYLSNDTILIANTGISTITNQPTEVKGIANFIEDGKLLAKFQKSSHLSREIDYLILETDYDSYSVVYSCSENLNGTAQRSELAWVLTRSKYPAPSVVEKARSVLINNDISTEFLINTNQLRCSDDY